MTLNHVSISALATSPNDRQKQRLREGRFAGSQGKFREMISVAGHLVGHRVAVCWHVLPLLIGLIKIKASQGGFLGAGLEARFVRIGKRQRVCLIIVLGSPIKAIVKNRQIAIIG